LLTHGSSITRPFGAGRRAASGTVAQDRVLVVLLCETRAWELTLETFTSNVLDQLNADLALCVGDRESPNPLYDRARYVWRLHEPDDWATAFDGVADGSSWRVLLDISEQFLGGIEDAEHPQIGSGAIILFFREFLRQSLEREEILDSYDWIIITRSDFIWPVSHPRVEALSNRRIYLLDGEQHGGVPDRHFIVPRRFFDPVLSIADPIFKDPEGLKRRIERVSERQGWFLMNVERFLALRLRELGLWRFVRYLPYVPYTVRTQHGSSRWSLGVFDKDLGYYVKYPTEKERSEIARRLLRAKKPWEHYLSPVRGSLQRHRLKAAYRERGLYERAFTRRESLRRTARKSWEAGREGLTRWRDRAAATVENLAASLGAQLRKLPVMSSILDARVRRMRRRAGRRQADP
jgi:hypothetical protein